MGSAGGAACLPPGAGCRSCCVSGGELLRPARGARRPQRAARRQPALPRGRVQCKEWQGGKLSQDSASSMAFKNTQILYWHRDRKQRKCGCAVSRRSLLGSLPLSLYHSVPGPDSMGGSQAEGGLFRCLKKLFSNLPNGYETLFKCVCHLVPSFFYSVYKNVTHLTWLAVSVRFIWFILELLSVKYMTDLCIQPLRMREPVRQLWLLPWGSFQSCGKICFID